MYDPGAVLDKDMLLVSFAGEGVAVERKEDASADEEGRDSDEDDDDDDDEEEEEVEVEKEERACCDRLEKRDVGELRSAARFCARRDRAVASSARRCTLLWVVLLLLLVAAVGAGALVCLLSAAEEEKAESPWSGAYSCASVDLGEERVLSAGDGRRDAGTAEAARRWALSGETPYGFEARARFCMRCLARTVLRKMWISSSGCARLKYGFWKVWIPRSGRPAWQKP